MSTNPAYGATRSREQDVATRIRAVLGERNWTKSELNRRMHRTQTWVSARLNYRVRTQLDDFDEFADALGISPAWLLGFDDARPRGPRLKAAPLFQEPEVTSNPRTIDYKAEEITTPTGGTVTMVDFTKPRRTPAAGALRVRRYAVDL